MSPITLEEMKSVKLMNRTDTKFVTTSHNLQELLSMIDDEYYIQVTEGRDIAEYHTLYYDTQDNQMYLAHHNGRKTRQKLRIRSYLRPDLHFLEVKTKDNHGKTKKKRVQLDLTYKGNNDITLNEALIYFEPTERYSAFLSPLLWLNCEDMLPKIENAFSRMTLVNKAKTERLTIDTGLSFHNLETGNSIRLDNIAIIELKRDSLQPSPVLPCLNALRIFPMGFSKYCMGMALTNESLKRNRFKERLRSIEKI